MTQAASARTVLLALGVLGTLGLLPGAARASRAADSTAATTATAPLPSPGAGPPAPEAAATEAAEAAHPNLSHFDLSRPELQSFIEQAAAAGIERAQLMTLLAAAAPQPKIIDAITRPAEKTQQWWEYRAHMLTASRIEAGVRLWREHKELLDQVTVEYQVPAEYIVAVLGVETLYGRITGRFRVVDALATLAFDFPPRAGYFRRELLEFLLLAREDGFDPLSIRGSYAGAMGALQFMPSSFRKFAVSEDHGARRDLWTDWGDIFASTANYLHQAGWQYGAPVLADATARDDANLSPPEHLTLGETLGGLRARGLTIASALADDTPAILLAAPEADHMAYRVGFHNFYVITRYNSSPLYAMAVSDLAQAIRTQLEQEAAL